MNAKPAPLGTRLLCAKGTASPAGFVPSFAVAPARCAQPTRIHHSFHLDAELHRRMKLAAARLEWTGQDLVVAALAHYLAAVVPTLLPDDCPCLRPPSP
jgi:hypothetical protein